MKTYEVAVVDTSKNQEFSVEGGSASTSLRFQIFDFPDDADKSIGKLSFVGSGADGITTVFPTEDDPAEAVCCSLDLIVREAPKKWKSS